MSEATSNQAAPDGEGGPGLLIMLVVLIAVGAGIYTFSTSGVRDAAAAAKLTVQGRALLDAGKPVEALPILLQAAEANPNDLEANRALGEILGGLRRHAEARRFLEKAYALEPSARTALALGRGLTALEDHVAAEAPLEKALELNPADPEPYYYLGLGAMRRDDWSATARHLARFVAKADASPRTQNLLPIALRVLADAQQATGQEKEAIATLGRLVQLVPRELSIRFAYAVLRMDQEGVEQPIADAKAAAEAEGATFEDLVTYAHLLAFDPSQPGVARAPLEKAAAMAPDRAEPGLGLALEDARDGQLESAQAHLEKVVQQAPRHGGAKLLLAQIHRQAGRAEEARAIYEGLRGTGKGPRAEQGILGTYLDAGQYDEALAFVRGLFPDAPPGDPRHFLEAQTLQAAGKFAEAQQLLATLIEAGRDEDRELWTYYSGLFHLDAGDLDAARAAFGKLELPYTGEKARRLAAINLWAGVAIHGADPEQAKELWQATAKEGVTFGERALPTRACQRLIGACDAKALAQAGRIAEWTDRNDALVVEGLASELAGDLDAARKAYADAVADSAGTDFPARLALRGIERLAKE